LTCFPEGGSRPLVRFVNTASSGSFGSCRSPAAYGDATWYMAHSSSLTC